nr:uncharacterized protein CTRU02_01273 [Colletotrichum truncatum]KAF6800868.1 hypothetical protein CTRU02_01273 [Colletotrichum truncatum]
MTPLLLPLLPSGSKITPMELDVRPLLLVRLSPFKFAGRDLVLAPLVISSAPRRHGMGCRTLDVRPASCCCSKCSPSNDPNSSPPASACCHCGNTSQPGVVAAMPD